jgi:hypothetical protein
MIDGPPPPARRRWRVTLPGLGLVGALSAGVVWFGGADLRRAYETGSIDRRGIGSGRLNASESPGPFWLRTMATLVFVVGMPVLFLVMLVVFLRQRGEDARRD